jgi:hypothetical protein
MSSSPLHVEPDNLVTTGVCACCGRTSRRLTGYVSEGEPVIAAYIFHWTVGHFPGLPANIDLILGQWSPDATSGDRFAVSLELTVRDDRPDVRVIDAAPRFIVLGDLVGAAMERTQVIGTPLAAQVFSVIDAIFEQDNRLPILFEAE